MDDDEDAWSADGWQMTDGTCECECECGFQCGCTTRPRRSRIPILGDFSVEFRCQSVSQAAQREPSFPRQPNSTHPINFFDSISAYWDSSEHSTRRTRMRLGHRSHTRLPDLGSLRLRLIRSVGPQLCSTAYPMLCRPSSHAGHYAFGRLPTEMMSEESMVRIRCRRKQASCSLMLGRISIGLHSNT